MVYNNFVFAKQYNIIIFLDDKVEQSYGSLKESYAEFNQAMENENDKGEDDPFDKYSATEIQELCKQWKEAYRVAVGVSWGDLPFDKQQLWRKHGCDGV